MNTSHSRIRWTAVKLFIAAPMLFAVPSVALVLADAGVRNSAPFLAQVGFALAAIALASYILAPVFARFCLGSVAAGCFFGVLVCAVGAVAFGLSAAIITPDFSFHDHVMKPLGWFSVCGFPPAALTGLFFAGAAQRLTPPADQMQPASIRDDR